jgi:hypothetical protein
VSYIKLSIKYYDSIVHDDVTTFKNNVVQKSSVIPASELCAIQMDSLDIKLVDGIKPFGKNRNRQKNHFLELNKLTCGGRYWSATQNSGC